MIGNSNFNRISNIINRPSSKKYLFQKKTRLIVKKSMNSLKSKTAQDETVKAKRDRRRTCPPKSTRWTKNGRFYNMSSRLSPVIAVGYEMEYYAGGFAYVYTGRPISGRGVGDHRAFEGYFQNVFHVLADGRLTGSEFDEHVERMDVGDRARHAQVVFDAHDGRIVHEFERR